MDRSVLVRVPAACLLTVCVVVSFGCQTAGGGGGGADGPPPGDGTVAGCAGSWTGTFTGDDAGTMTIAAAANGVATGTTHSGAGFDGDFTGQLEASGVLTGTARVQGTTTSFNGQADLDACTVTGAWDNPAFGASGTWTARRQ